MYKNNNHFNVLIPKNDIENYIPDDDKEDSKALKIEKDIKGIKLNNLNKISFNKIFTKVYVPYRRSECSNLYKEIFNFLKKEEIPNRLKSTFMKNLDIYNKKAKSKDIDQDKYNPFIKKNNKAEDSKKKKKENI